MRSCRNRNGPGTTESRERKILNEVECSGLHLNVFLIITKIMPTVVAAPLNIKIL